MQERQDIETIDGPECVEPKPKVAAVLGLLVLAALTFSYLGAYAATSALANAEMIRPISREHDPRLRWALCMFVIIMSLFGLVALVMRLVSRRQFARIDEMNEAEEVA
jgi:hypothetical protein